MQHDVVTNRARLEPYFHASLIVNFSGDEMAARSSSAGPFGATPRDNKCRHTGM